MIASSQKVLIYFLKISGEILVENTFRTNKTCATVNIMYFIFTHFSSQKIKSLFKSNLSFPSTILTSTVQFSMLHNPKQKQYTTENIRSRMHMHTNFYTPLLFPMSIRVCGQVCILDDPDVSSDHLIVAFFPLPWHIGTL